MSVANPAGPDGAASVAVVTPRRRRWRPNTFDALHNRNFRLLLAGNTLQFTAQQMQNLVRGVLAYEITGSFTALGFMALANSVPGFLATPLGGVIADRVPKKTVIQAVQTFNALNAVMLALLAWSGHLGYEHLAITAVLQGAVNSVMTASRHTIIQDMVGRDRLMNGISLNVSVQNLMQLIGPGLGGALVAFTGATVTFWVMAGLYAGAVMFTLRLPKVPVDGPVEVSGPARAGGFGDLVDGLKYVAHDPTIRTHILVNFGIVLLATPYSSMLPGFVKEVLGKGAAEQGVLVGFSGAGALIGSLVVASYPPRHRGRLLLAISTMLALGLIAFSFSTSYYVTMPIMMFIGAGISLRMSVGQVILQTYSAEAFRGRTVAVWMTQYSIVSFGTFAVGVLAEHAGPQVAIGGMAVVLLAFVAAVALFVPRYRNLQ